MIIFKFVLFAFIIFIFFRYALKFVHLIPFRTEKIKWLIKTLPLFEFLVWTVWAYFFYKAFFSDFLNREIVFIILLLVASSLFAWVFLKDYMAGIFLKADSGMALNKNIRLPHLSGVISKMGYRYVEIKNENGDVFKLPYSKLSNEIITFPSKEDLNAYKHETTLLVHKNTPYQHYIKTINNSIMCSVWAHTAKTPHISLLSQDDLHYIFNVEFFTLDKEHAEKIELMLKEKFTTQNQK